MLIYYLIVVQINKVLFSGGWMKEKVKIKVFDTQSFNLERE